MSTVEVETGTYIKRFAFWNPATWGIPKLYWDAISQEQRLAAICRQLEKVIKYADYLGVNVDDIAARMKAIEEGQLDELITSEIEAWFEENEPFIIQSLDNLNSALPLDSFDSENTVEAAIAAVRAIFGTGFDSDNTVRAALGATFNAENTVESAIEDLNGKFPVTEDELADNVIRNLYVEPELIGDYTAFSGKFITSTADPDDPFRPQGFCYVTDDELMQLLINDAEDRMRPVEMDIPGNSYQISETDYSGFGHANQVEYVPSRSRYYINDGLGNIVVCNAAFNIVTRVPVPNQEWATFVYDRKNDKAYVIDYYSKIYNYNLDTNTITDAGYELEMPIQSGSVTVQGAALYDNIAVFPISKKPTGILCYDVRTGKYLATVTINQNGDEVYPISEIEDVSFDNDGNMYIAAATVLTDLDYCMVSTIWKCNIFRGYPVTSWWSTSTELHEAHVECINYNGFKSDGSATYPFKSLESLCIHCQHMPNKIKAVNMGIFSNYSTNDEQDWYGFAYFSGMNICMRFNSQNKITIHGTLEFRNSCNVWFLNRLVLASCYNPSKNWLFRIENSTLNAQTIEAVAGNGDSGVTRILLMQYTINVVINGVINTANIANLYTANQIHGSGFIINVNPHQLNGSWS